MGLKGNLATVNLADVFQVLSRGNSTGLLRIMVPGDTRYVEIMNGSISIVSRPGVRVLLGDLLRARGLLSDEGLESALGNQRETGKMLGQVLVDLGLVKREDIEAALRFQVEEEICDLFTIKEGEFDFLANARVDSKMALGGGFIRLKIDPNNILLEAARRLDEWASIEQKVPGQGAIFRLTPKGLGWINSSEVDEDTKLVLRLVTEDRTFEAMVQKACLGRFSTGQILAKLVEEGAIEPHPKERYAVLGRLHLDEGRLDEAERIFAFALKCYADQMGPELKAPLEAGLAEINKRKTAAQETEGKTRSEIVKRKRAQMAEAPKAPVRAYAGIGGAVVVVLGVVVYFVFFHGKSQGVVDGPLPDQRFSDLFVQVNEEADKKNYAKAAQLMKGFQAGGPKEIEKLKDLTEIMRQVMDRSARTSAEEGRNLLKDNKREAAYALQRTLETRFDGVDLNPDVRKELDQFVAKAKAAEKEEAVNAVQKRLDDMAAQEATNLISAREAYQKMLDAGVPEEVKPRVEERISRIDSMVEEAKKRLASALEHEKGGRDELAQAEYEWIQKSLPGSIQAADAQARTKDILRRLSAAKHAFDSAAKLAADGKTDEAVAEFEDFLKRYPLSSLVARARTSLEVLRVARKDVVDLFDRAQKLEQEGEKDKARELYLMLIDKYPTTEQAKKVMLPIEIRSVPEGAAVAVDGAPAGNTPTTVKLAPLTEHRIAVSKAGFKPEEIAKINHRVPFLLVTLNKDLEYSLRVPNDAAFPPAVLGDALFSVHDMDLVAMGGNRPTQQWRQTLGEQAAKMPGMRKGPPPLAFPFVADGSLYVCTGQAQIKKVDPKTGNAESFATLRGRVVAEPICYETNLIRGRKFLVALTTHGIEWVDMANKQSKATELPAAAIVPAPAPNLVRVKDSVCIGWTDGNLYCLDPLSGDISWKVPTGATGFLRLEVLKNTVIVLSVSGSLTTYAADNKGAPGPRRDMTTIFHAGPLAVEDVVVVGDTDGHVTAMNAEGRPKWSLNVEGAIECPMVADRACVYAATAKGMVYAFGFDGRLVWSLKVEGEPAQLAVTNTRLLVYTRDGHLYTTRTGGQ